ncbi:MAG: hypothetical protein LBK47_01745 [Prevotellaceae bacterium]|jgi:hypothetical protein|nr:hypothetical protein [Prevotellaceae bacterium]
MKKLMFIALAAMFASCCHSKCNETKVEEIAANPAKYAGKEVTFSGKAIVADAEAGRILVSGKDSSRFILVVANEGKVCPSLCGKKVKVSGKVVEVVAEVAVADSNLVAVEVLEGYYVAAAKIEKADCCKKDGEKCGKSDSAKCCAKADSAKCCKKDTAACQKPAAEKKDAKK